MRFTEALEEYWLEKTRNFSKSTVADYSGTFTKFRRFLVDDIDVEQITDKHIRGFLNHLVHVENLAPKTTCNAWIALSSFWSWAETELDIRHIMKGRVKQPKVPRRQIEPYTEVEVKALLAAAKSFDWLTRNGHKATSSRPTGLRDVAMIVVLVDTGLRVSELTACTVADYHEGNGRMIVRHGKGDKRRDVYLGQTAQQALQQYLATRNIKSDGEHLFVTSSSLPMDRAGVLHMIKNTALRAGVKSANVPRFRHTFAINFLRNNGNLLELQSLLGHEHMDTVQIYARLASVDLEQAQRRSSPADNWAL